MKNCIPWLFPTNYKEDGTKDYYMIKEEELQIFKSSFTVIYLDNITVY